MARAIEQTVRHLAKSNNRAASRLLFAAVHSSHAPVRQSACRHLLSSSAPAKQLIRDIGSYNEATLDTLRDQVSRLIPVLCAAIASEEAELRRNAFEAVRALRIIEIIPELLGMIFSTGGYIIPADDKRIEKLIETVVYLAGVLSEASSDDSQAQVNIHQILDKAASVLDRSLRQVTARTIAMWMRLFILLFPHLLAYNNSICRVVDDSSHPSYTAIYRFLLSGPVEVVGQFLFDRLQEKEEIPKTLIGVLSKRNDAAFLGVLFDFLASSSHVNTVAPHLQRITDVSWATTVGSVLQRLTSTQQVGLVHFIGAVSISQSERLTALQTIFDKADSPTAKAQALAALPLDAEHLVDEIIAKGLESSEPEVQCAALKQADAIQLPGAVSTIFAFADSPDERVRDTVAELFPNVRFPRFLEVYDSLDPRHRKALFKKVCSIDPHVVSSIRTILAGDNVKDQSKVLHCILDGELLDPLEDEVGQLALRGTTEELRIDAVRLLTFGRRTITRNILIQILHRDPSEAVRRAAQEVLERRPVA